MMGGIYHPKANSSPLKKGKLPKGNEFSNHPYVGFRGGYNYFQAFPMEFPKGIFDSASTEWPGCLRCRSGQQPELFCPQRHAGSTFEGSNPGNQSESSPTKDHTRDDSARTRRCELEKSSETHLGGVFGGKKVDERER